MTVAGKETPANSVPAAAVIRRGFLYQVLSLSSLAKVLYDPKAFVTHAAWLDQGFPHCLRFPTAATRRSLARISVPVWGIFLSEPLPIVALVSCYLTN